MEFISLKVDEFMSVFALGITPKSAGKGTFLFPECPAFVFTLPQSLLRV